MDRLTPLDLQKAKLPSRLRGFDRKATQALLGRAAEEIEALRKELRHAKEMADGALRELEIYRAQEATLREALVLAQKTADEARANARREAELIVEEAQRRAAEVRREAEQQLSQLRWDIERLHVERGHLRERMRAMLEAMLRALEDGRSLQPALVNLDTAAGEAAS
jgi:cell division initiation protein